MVSPLKQHQDQEAGWNSGGPYSVKFCDKAVSDSTKAEHVQDVHVCVLRNDKHTGLKAYQQSAGHFLTLHLIEQRVIKWTCHLQHYTNSSQRISFHIWKYLQYWGGLQSTNWLSLCHIISRNSWQGSKDPERPSSFLSHDLVWTVVCHHQTSFLWKGRVKTSAKV